MQTYPQSFAKRREKIFGIARGFAHDWHARDRIKAYVHDWSEQHKKPGQHQGPITAAFKRVLDALLFKFLNYRDGRCFPAYEAIAAKAKCHRSTVHRAIKALEETGVFEWVNRIDRVRERVMGLLGPQTVTRVIRRSNCYLFRDPLPCAPTPERAKSQNATGLEIQESFLKRWPVNTRDNSVSAWRRTT
jgi:AraC-like DNA-binding protein